MVAVSELSDKQFYEELTDKQQTVVDYLAENPEATYTEIESETGIHNTYAGAVAKKYDHIIAERQDMENNKHLNERGNVKTVGEIDLTDAPGEQSIQDRPVKDTSEEQDEEQSVEELLDPATLEIPIRDGDLRDRLEAISDEITPDWMDSSATPEETVRYLARMYHGEVNNE